MARKRNRNRIAYGGTVNTLIGGAVLIETIRIIKP